MSYETIPIVKADAKTVHILTGTIVSTGAGVAEVNIDGYGVYSDVPVFYHCPESETADGIPFTIGDRVIIVNSGDAITLSVSNMKVVGFEDGLPRRCLFYIRPTFNGFSPVYGGEIIKVENGNFNESNATTISGSFAGLCGPFTGDVATGNEHISLNKWVGAGINPNYVGINNLFSHFVEVAEEDAAYHYGYNFRTLTWFSAGKKEFEIYSPHPSPILHVNRIDWLGYGNILSGCPKTYETIGGVKYAIYQVDFTNLYLPAMIRTLKLQGLTELCTGCSFTAISEEDPKYYAITINSISANLFQGDGSCVPFQGAGCEPEASYSDQTNYGMCWWSEGIRNHVLEFAVSKEQICILSDEFGQNPSYTPITINTRLWNEFSAQGCCDGGGGDAACIEEDTDYPDYCEYKYEMTLAPEDKF